MTETLITTKEVQEKVHLSVLDVIGKCHKVLETPEVLKQLKQYFKNFAFNTDCIVKTQADNDDTLIVELCFTYGSILYICLYRMGKFLVTYYTTIDDQLVECFKIQRNSYNQEVFNLQELVKPISFAPSVMCDLKTSSTWYTPGGNSTIARLYADAGANYIFREDTHSGSLPYPFEVIFEKGQQTDFWLIRYNQPIDKTYKELEKEFAPYAGTIASR